MPPRVVPDQKSDSVPARAPQASGPQPLSVLMVAGAARDGERLRCQHLISEQARSLRCHDLRISLHGVDDRRRPSGIWRNMQTLRRAVSLESPDIVHVQYGSVLALIGLLSAHGAPLQAQQEYQSAGRGRRRQISSTTPELGRSGSLSSDDQRWGRV